MPTTETSASGEKRADGIGRVWSRAIAASLGANLWLVVFLIPVWQDQASWSFVSVGLTFAPGVALAFGVFSGSSTWLLGIFPSTLALVSATFARSLLGRSYLVSGTGFALAALSLAGYLVLVAAALEWERRPLFDPRRRRRLQDSGETSQWKRRRRVYAYLLAATVVFPALLLYGLNVRGGAWAILQAAYEERAGHMKVLINVGVAAFWTMVYFVLIRRPLHLHQKGDRPLRREIRQYERGNRRPGAAIVALSVLALALLALFWAAYGFGG